MNQIITWRSSRYLKATFRSNKFRVSRSQLINCIEFNEMKKVKSLCRKGKTKRNNVIISLNSKKNMDF